MTNYELNLKFLANFSQNKNTCSGNPPTNLEQYGIADTGDIQNYIRVNTPCSSKQLIKIPPKSSYLTVASCKPPIGYYYI